MGFFSKLFGNGQKVNPNGVYAPVAGKAVPLSAVPDATFAEGMLGYGVAIEPTDGKICAPCDGKIDTMFATGHAVAMTAKNGAEILIHVGLETVGLEGKPFTIHCKNGDEVKKGDLLMEADLDMIKAAGLNTITPVVVCNSDEFSTFNVTTGCDVTNDNTIVVLAK